MVHYWYEGSPQGWNRITRAVGAAKQLDLRKQAQLLALLNTPPIPDYLWYWYQNSVKIHNFEGVVRLDLVVLPQAGRQCMRTHLPYLHCGVRSSSCLFSAESDF
jgi:hypothetical protein